MFYLYRYLCEYICNIKILGFLMTKLIDILKPEVSEALLLAN